MFIANIKLFSYVRVISTHLPTYVCLHEYTNAAWYKRPIINFPSCYTIFVFVEQHNKNLVNMMMCTCFWFVMKRHFFCFENLCTNKCSKRSKDKCSFCQQQSNTIMCVCDDRILLCVHYCELFFNHQLFYFSSTHQIRFLPIDWLLYFCR